MYRTVVWATDGSEAAEGALHEALRLTAPGGLVIAVHCDQRMAGRAGAWSVLADEDELQAAIRARVSALKEDGVAIDLLVRRTHDEPAELVAAIAQERDADAIVCGTRGRGPLTGAVLGSFAHRLLHMAHCPVVVVPARQTVEAEKPAKLETVV
jgi:nucleotide-binding universal stress UspA family protein